MAVVEDEEPLPPFPPFPPFPLLGAVGIAFPFPFPLEPAGLADVLTTVGIISRSPVGVGVVVGKDRTGVPPVARAQ